VSGSMSGRKIEDARAAVSQLISQLGAEDRFALVTFSSSPQTTIPLAAATDGARARWRDSLLAVHAGGGTHMGPALDLAFATIEGSRSAMRVPRVLLISDGLAAEGHPILHDQARRAASGGFPLTTVGVGADFDENLMASLADIGTGNYYYLAHAHALADVFANEFETARETVASALEVAIRPAAGIAVVEASGYPLERSGDATRFRPGSLFAGQQRRIWVTLRVPTDRVAEHALGSFTLQFQRNGETERLTLPTLPQVAAVASQEDFFAALDVDRWSQSVVEEEYGALQQRVAKHVRDGRLGEARGAVRAFVARNTEMNEVAASPSVALQLDAAAELEASVQDAFEGDDQARKRNSLGKEIHAQSYVGRRAGSRK
jgi:Ca-activated chloride channel family protein